VNPGELELMARAEERHWWYRGLRDVIARCLERPELAPGSAPRVLDAGCGTGANLAFLRDLLAPSYLAGFDVSEDAVRMARAKAPEAEVYPSDICDPELRCPQLDLVVSLDVVYIPGVARAMAGLRRLVASLRPGGLFVLHLPAYDWLYSAHDVAVHTTERYTVGRVRALMGELGLRPERWTYRLCLLFPAVLLVRLPGKLRAAKDDTSVQSDLRNEPGRLASSVCYRMVRLENGVIARGGRWPFGSSVFAVGRKP
jgi:SAM-dependent methyltransferase